ncbi:MAG: hypothetical protein ACK5JL_07145 [Candidatus Kapaibacterium sp.]|jgi:hypothetical protein
MNSTKKTSNVSLDVQLPVWLPFLLFAVATAFFFRGHLFGNLFFWDDFAEYVFPVRAFAAHHMAQGSLPFWNPYTFGGMPFLADVQTAVFYPPNLLLDLIAGDGEYPIKALQVMIIVHFFIAQCSMYLFGRKVGISQGGSILAAIGYGFSSPLVLHAFHPMQVEHLAWFPLVAMLVYAAVTEKSLLHGVIGGLVLGMAMLSGSPQMTLYMAFVLGCMILWLSVSDLVPGAATGSASGTASASGVISKLATGLLVPILGFGVFCVQFLPVQEIAKLSERAEMTYEKATVGSLELGQIITTTVPKAYGSISPDAKNKAPFFLHERDYYLYWDTAFFFGAVTFLLGLFGAIRSWRTSLGLFLIVMSVFGFLFALGSNGFVFPLFFKLPFFNALRIPARMMFVVGFAFSVLAGFGFDALFTSSKLKGNSMPQLLLAFAVPALLAVGVAAGVFVTAPADAIQTAVQGYGTTALLIVIGTGVIALLAQRSVISPLVALACFAALSYSDLIIANGDFNAGKANPVKEAQSLFPQSLQSVLLPSLPDSAFRVSMRAPGVIALKRNQGMIDKVMLYEGYNQLLLAKRHPAITDIKTMLDVLGVKYEISTDPATGGAGFMRRPDCYPNAWMTYATRQATEQTMKTVMNDAINFRTTTVVEDSGVQFDGKAYDSTARVTCTEYKDNSLRYTVTSSQPGVAVFNEIWYPSWAVWIDGKQATPLRVNTCQRGVVVPAGTHTVEWRFVSESFQNGFRISLGTLVFAIALLVVHQYNQRRMARAA